MINSLLEWRSFCNKEHDITCNQKYGDTLPYSFHLDCVFKQGMKWLDLLESDSDRLIAMFALARHDLIEDTRMTYKDVLHKVEQLILLDETFRMQASKFESVAVITNLIAETIYNVTDDKGRNRKERKNEEYYTELRKNHIAVFVKLCDLASNTMFSKLTAHSMYGKYKREFPNFKEKLYLEQFEELFNFVENI